MTSPARCWQAAVGRRGTCRRRGMCDEAFTNHRCAAGGRRAGPRSAAGAVGTEPPDSDNNNSAKLRQAVTVAGILEHEQRSRRSPTPRRATGSPAPPATTARRTTSRTRAAAAGFNVSVQEFEYALDFLADFEPPVLDIVGGTEFVAGIAGASLGGDFGSMFKRTPYSVDITAPVWAIDLALPAVGPPNTSTSGCEAADYAGMPAGAIIIVQRGTCTFAQKFALADASGAGAMVFINEGQAGPDGAAVVQLRRDRHPDVRGDGRDRDGAGERCAAGRHRPDGPFQDRVAARAPTRPERHRRDPSGRSEQRDRGRSPPRPRRRRARHQRQRLRLGGDPRDRRADDEGEAAQQGALHLVRRRGVRPARLRGVRREPQPRRNGDRSPRC